MVGDDGRYSAGSSDDSLNAKDNLRWKAHSTVREAFRTIRPTRSAELESSVES